MGNDTRLEPTEVLQSVLQLGIIVADLDARIAGMRQVFGVEPVTIMECNYPSIRYDGETLKAQSRIARYNQFGIFIEFIEPLGEARTMWSDALEASPNGYVLHHIRFNDVPDNDAVTAMMAERGVPLLQEGDSVAHPGGKFTFYDTEKLVGFVTEVVTSFED